MGHQALHTYEVPCGIVRCKPQSMPLARRFLYYANGKSIRRHLTFTAATTARYSQKYVDKGQQPGQRAAQASTNSSEASTAAANDKAAETQYASSSVSNDRSKMHHKGAEEVNVPAELAAASSVRATAATLHKRLRQSRQWTGQHVMPPVTPPPAEGKAPAPAADYEKVSSEARDAERSGIAHSQRALGVAHSTAAALPSQSIGSAIASSTRAPAERESTAEQVASPGGGSRPAVREPSEAASPNQAASGQRNESGQSSYGARSLAVAVAENARLLDKVAQLFDSQEASADQAASSVASSAEQVTQPSPTGDADHEGDRESSMRATSGMERSPVSSSKGNSDSSKPGDSYAEQKVWNPCQVRIQCLAISHD